MKTQSNISGTGSTDNVRQALADAAKMHAWPQVLTILKEHPELVNATRPGGTSLYTPLHQAAYGGAPVDVVQRLLALGASVTAQNAKGERPVDVAKRRSQLHLVELLEPPVAPAEEHSRLHFPSDITQALTTCALRFDGYAYVDAMARAQSDQPAIDLSHLVDSVVGSLRLHDNLNDNFAAFFGLQRYLHKWGGEHLTKYSDEHIAYDFLFLDLYRQTPVAYRHEEYCRAWDVRYAPRAEEIAAYVRKSFRRIGDGPEFV